MIKLTFKFNLEVMYFTIKNREIYYTDKIWKDSIRCIPKDEKFIEIVRNSRNKYSPKLIEMFTLSKAQQEEYTACKDDEELSDVIIRDCNRKGIKLLRKEVENGVQ